MKTRGHGRNQRGLLAHRFGIEIRIHSAQNLRQERKEVELDRQAVLARGHQIRFHRAQRALVRLAVLVGELVPARPPSGANHVQPGVVNLPQIAVPHINIGMIEIQPLHFARHVRRADDGQRLAIQLEVVFVHAELGAGAQVVEVANPEGGVVDGAWLRRRR